jgi:hypothetical protein
MIHIHSWQFFLWLVGFMAYGNGIGRIKIHKRYRDAPPIYVGTLHQHEKSEVIASIRVSKMEQAKLKTLLGNFEPLILHIDNDLYYVIQPTGAGGRS